MKFLSLILLAFITSTVDTPPVVTVHLTATEVATLKASADKVTAAQNALHEAENQQAVTEFTITEHYRQIQQLPQADCSFAGATIMSFQPAQSTQPSAEPQGYLSNIEGEWIIFKRGFAQCHPA